MARQVIRQVKTPPVAERLKEAQAQAQLNTSELARRVGVSVRLMQKWRAGSTTPRYDNVLRLADELDKPVGYFYEDAA